MPVRAPSSPRPIRSVARTRAFTRRMTTKCPSTWATISARIVTMPKVMRLRVKARLASAKTVLVGMPVYRMTGCAKSPKTLKA